MIYISHRLEELPVIADRVTVLRDGNTIATREMADVNREQLIQMMVGRELAAVFPKRTVPLGDTVLELRGVGCAASGVSDVDLTRARGRDRRAVGARRRGTLGARAHDLRAHAGRSRRDPACAASACASARRPTRSRNGIAYVPEDRRRHGVVLEMPVSENVTLAALGNLSRFGALDFRRERELAADYTRRLGVKTRVDPLARVDALGRQPAEGGAEPLAR